MRDGVTKLGLGYQSMAEVDDDDAWQEPKSTRQIGGNIVDKKGEELDEEKLRERDLTNAGSDEENERPGRGSGGREEERRRRKIEEDHGWTGVSERRGR